MLDGWQSTQRVTCEGAIESQQRARLPRPVVEQSEHGARSLGDGYWREVEACTARLVRARRSATGVQLRAFGLLLLAFDPAELHIADGEVSCAFPIRGGILVRRRGGELTLARSSGSAPEVCSTITGFFPTLGARPGGPSWTGALYSQVQRRIHLAVSRRYFRRLIAEGGA